MIMGRWLFDNSEVIPVSRVISVNLPVNKESEINAWQIFLFVDDELIIIEHDALTSFLSVFIF